MKQIGSFLLLFGIGSIILNFFNYQFIILSWIDIWGSTIAWVIRVAMLVVGTALFFIGSGEEESA